MSDTIDRSKYPSGLITFRPQKNAPSNVVADVIITVDKFLEWMRDYPEEITDHEQYGKQIRFTIVKGKHGRLYTQVTGK